MADEPDFRAPGEPAWWEARRIVRAGSSATLATQAGGQPFAALVTPATAVDGALLVLLSGLSEHTRQLRADGRCALLICGGTDDPNPQAGPRVSVSGTAAPNADPALRARWLARHPYAAFYADLPDFVLWRVEPSGANFIGGFARAFRLTCEDLVPAPAAVAALEAAGPGIMTHCNDDHADALSTIATRAGRAAGAWRMVAVDPDGFDLGLENEVLRVAWPLPVDDTAGVRRELARMAGIGTERQG